MSKGKRERKERRKEGIKEGRGAGKLKEHPCLYQRRRKIHSEISRGKKGEDINDKKPKRGQLEEGRSGP